MPINFTERENDVIESQLDLEQSIINTLATFFEEFGQKLIYKVSFVSSITLQDGTKKSGGSIKVQTGTFPNGAPKYKIILNKFAALDIFLKLEGQPQRKLGRFILAPVNILTYKPSSEDLTLISEGVKNIIKAGPGVAVFVPEKGMTTPLKAPDIIEKARDGSGFIKQYRKLAGEDGNDIAKKFGTTLVRLAEIGGTNQENLLGENFKSKIGAVVWVPALASVPDTAPPDSGSGIPPGNLLLAITSLYEWYRAQGQVLPPHADRAQLYQQLGLGPKELYVGSIEQNKMMLKKLKG